MNSYEQGTTKIIWGPSFEVQSFTKQRWHKYWKLPMKGQGVMKIYGSKSLLGERENSKILVVLQTRITNLKSELSNTWSLFLTEYLLSSGATWNAGVPEFQRKRRKKRDRDRISISISVYMHMDMYIYHSYHIHLYVQIMYIYIYTYRKLEFIKKESIGYFKEAFPKIKGSFHFKDSISLYLIAPHRSSKYFLN